MPAPIRLSRSDARRAMVRHHFAPAPTMEAAFERLRSVQFDPIAPVGCNHDLVLQARVEGYRVGDWQRLAYAERKVYDGWDKQACLIPFAGWPLRRVYHGWVRNTYDRVATEHPGAMETILAEIAARGPLLPRECEFQEHRPDWKGTWYGPSVTKQALRALWNVGQVMTAGRRNGQHLYDLAERVVPPDLYAQPQLSEAEAIREIVMERHRAVGLVRPGASSEVWSYARYTERRPVIAGLADAGELVPVEVEGVLAHATPAFLSLLDRPSLEQEATFVAPLDPFLWDRKTIAHLFGFDYVWEIYTPEAKRRWGYYVLPVRFGDALVARAEFFARGGTLELRRWHTEGEGLPPGFLDALAPALGRFMGYCGANAVRVAEEVEPTIRDLAAGCAPLLPG